jgi:hypothetical protein
MRRQRAVNLVGGHRSSILIADGTAGSGAPDGARSSRLNGMRCPEATRGRRGLRKWFEG